MLQSIKTGVRCQSTIAELVFWIRVRLSSDFVQGLAIGGYINAVDYFTVFVVELVVLRWHCLRVEKQRS